MHRNEPACDFIPCLILIFLIKLRLLLIPFERRHQHSVIHTVDDVVQRHPMPKSHEGHIDHIGNHRRRQSLLEDFLTHESHYNTREHKVT